MKRILVILVIIITAACSKKNIPSISTNSTIIDNNNTSKNNNSGEVINADTLSSINKTSALAFIVITDGYGKIVNQKQALPAEANVHFDELQLSKGFTAQQKLNLKTRYKTIPPRVLYVNPQNQLSSARGTYYILGKKFWYWKKNDGLFYLDGKYYL